MNNVIIFGGTHEGRKLCRFFEKKNTVVDLFVAAEYGETSSGLEKDTKVKVHVGKLDEGRIRHAIAKIAPTLVVDATHPYAVEITNHLRKLCTELKIEYVRIIRENKAGYELAIRKSADMVPVGSAYTIGELSVIGELATLKELSVKGDLTETEGKDRIIIVESIKDAVEYLKNKTGNIFVATGATEIYEYMDIPNYENRVYARILPSHDIVKVCNDLGFTGKHLMCLEGPFSKQLNLALMKECNASYMVTRESGMRAGFIEKIEAAFEAGVKVIVVKRPYEEGSVTVDEFVARLQKKED